MFHVQTLFSIKNISFHFKKKSKDNEVNAILTLQISNKWLAQAELGGVISLPRKTLFHHFTCAGAESLLSLKTRLKCLNLDAALVCTPNSGHLW
jgi:hypothetical protein